MSRTNSFQLFLDFDQTITTEHTFRERQMFSGGTRVPDPTFSKDVSDANIRANLRYPKQVRALMKAASMAGFEISILTNHNNIPWIQRNLKVLGVGALFDEGHIIATQATGSTYEGQQKGAIIQQKLGETSAGGADDLDGREDVSITILVDDDSEQFQTGTPALNDDERVQCIHAQEGDEAYLDALARALGFANMDAVYIAEYMYDRRQSEKEYKNIFGGLCRIFGGKKGQEKLDAANALINSLADDDIPLDQAYLDSLKQGNLGKLVRDLKIDLDALVSRAPATTLSSESE